jgi:hypothetical protein
LCKYLFDRLYPIALNGNSNDFRIFDTSELFQGRTVRVASGEMALRSGSADKVGLQLCISDFDVGQARNLFVGCSEALLALLKLAAINCRRRYPSGLSLSNVGIEA